MVCELGGQKEDKKKDHYAFGEMTTERSRPSPGRRKRLGDGRLGISG